MSDAVMYDGPLQFDVQLGEFDQGGVKAFVSPRNSACHCPPPNGGPSHQAMRAALLKIAAAARWPPRVGDRTISSTA